MSLWQRKKIQTMPRILDPKSERKKYLELRDQLFAGKKVASSVAHNAISNRKEAASPTVNQIYSLTEMLEAGFGLEIDIHIGDDGKLRVCHSPFDKKCLDTLLGETSLSYVTEQIREFLLNNPERSVFVTVESHGNPKKLNEESEKELQDFLFLAVKVKALDEQENKEYTKKLVEKPYIDNGFAEECFQLDLFKRQDGDGFDFNLFENYEGYKGYKKIFEINSASQEISKRGDNSFSRGFLDVLSPEEKNEILEDLVDKSYQLLPQLDRSLFGKDTIVNSDVIFDPQKTLEQRNHYINSEVAYRFFNEVLLFAGIQSFSLDLVSDDNKGKLSLGLTIALEGGENFMETCENLVSQKFEGTYNMIVEPPRIIKNYYAKGAVEKGVGVNRVNPESANFFREVSSNNAKKDEGFVTVYENSLMFPFYSGLDSETIDKLLEVGVDLFKFDYVAAGNEIDARMLQVDLHNINKYLESDDLLTDQERQDWFLLRDLNLELSEKEQQHSKIPVNSVVVSPFVGKPLAELSVACAAIGCLGLLQQEQQNFARDNTEKYDPYNSFLLTALSVGALVLVGEMVRKKVVSFSPNFARGISATLGAADLYLYSQSVIPFGVALLASMFSAKQSEVLGKQITTALPYAASAFVRYSLDPQSSFQNTVTNVTAALTGAVLAVNAAKLIGEKSQLNSQKRE